jgi:uncharacterized protein
LKKFILVLLVVSAVSLFAAETPIPPTPTRWVTDTAGFMSPQAVSSLDRRLEAYERQSGHQVLVYIGKTTGDDPIEDWAVRAFKQWKVGRKGIDDGLVLFIMSQDRKLKIEVGYGLEGDVTDILASRVINDVIVPRIRAGDQDGAVTAGVDAIVGVIGGQGLPAAAQQQQRRDRGERRPLTLGQLIVYGIIGIVILLILITNPSLAVWLLMSMMSSGNRRNGGGGGGWGGGGGFGGGGGRSGGGGASGSW